MQTPTLPAIETAIRRADAMHGVYSCVPVPGLAGRSYVQHNEQPERCYLVDTRNGKQRCSCKAFEKAAVCKHIAFGRQVEAEQEADARADFEAFGKHLAGRF